MSTSLEKNGLNFFRAGGVIQVDIRGPEDLKNLGSLDQKLWMALAMPTRGLSADTRTLDLIDSDKDGRIRPPEILAAVAFMDTNLRDLRFLFQDGDSIALEHFRDPARLAGAERALKQIGCPAKTEICVADIDQAMAQLSAEVFNGDGIIVPECGPDLELQTLLSDMIAFYDRTQDRSGLPGIDQEISDRFFGELELRQTWFQELGHDSSIAPLGLALTETAYGAFQAVASKIEDFFTRCSWIAFDPRATEAANRYESEFAIISQSELSQNSSMLAELPIAHISKTALLPLLENVNPAWIERITAFASSTVETLLGQKLNTLSLHDWSQIKAKLAAFQAWKAREPEGAVRRYDAAEVEKILHLPFRQSISNLINSDLALAPEYASLGEVRRCLLYRRDLLSITQNLISFTDFYRKQKAIFQVGTLFIDGRSTDLCIDVSCSAKHSAMAGLSGAFLVYCECSRAEQSSRTIVALITNGDGDNLMVGRNGVFYDRQGLDWDATITKIVANPISLRAAFWSPYKKLARFIEEQIAKRAAVLETTQDSRLTQAAKDSVTAAKPAAAAANKTFDVGTIAAMGVAFGSISTFLGIIFSKFVDLGMFMPIGIVALLLAISGPSVFLAWMKLKNRNLGPILDANGWAINTVARLNVPFAASMTLLRKVPVSKGALLPDPYAERHRPWRLLTAAAIVLILIVAYSQNKLDRFLPEKLQMPKDTKHAESVEN